MHGPVFIKQITLETYHTRQTFGQLLPAFCFLMSQKQPHSIFSILSIIENISWFIGFWFTHWLPLALFLHPHMISWHFTLLKYFWDIFGYGWPSHVCILVLWLLHVCTLWFHFTSCVTFFVSSQDACSSFLKILHILVWRTSCWVLSHAPKFFKISLSPVFHEINPVR